MSPYNWQRETTSCSGYRWRLPVRWAMAAAKLSGPSTTAVMVSMHTTNGSDLNKINKVIGHTKERNVTVTLYNKWKSIIFFSTSFSSTRFITFFFNQLVYIHVRWNLLRCQNLCSSLLDMLYVFLKICSNNFCYHMCLKKRSITLI